MTTIKFPAKALALRLELHLFHSRQLVRPQSQAPGLDFPNWAHCLISLEPYAADPRVWPLLLLLAGELDKPISTGSKPASTAGPSNGVNGNR